MTPKTTLSFDSDVDGAAPVLPSGWTSSGSGPAFVVSAAAKVHGPLGLRLPAVTTSYRRLTYAETASATPWALSMYVTPRALSTAVMYIAAVYNGASALGDVRINVAGTVTIRNGTTAVATSSATLAVDTAYRFEWKVTPTTGQELRVYAGDATTPLFTLTGAFAGTTVTGFAAGLTGAAANYAADYDSIVVADDFTGPWATTPPPTPVTPLFTYPISYPVYAAHRGGAPGPEETLYAYQQSYALNPAFAAEGDMWLLADGGIAFCHDSTIDRTADPSSEFTTGDVASFTTPEWNSILFAPDATSEDFTPRPGMTLADLIAEYGPSSGRNRLLVPEINTSQSSAPFIAAIKSGGIADRTIVQSFSLTKAQEAAAAGLEAMFVIQSGVTPDWPAYKTAGINHVSMNKTLLTQTNINDAHAAGLKVWVFTVNTTAERDSWLAMGVDAFFSDQPSVLVPPVAAPVVKTGAGNEVVAVSQAAATSLGFAKSGLSLQVGDLLLVNVANQIAAAAGENLTAPTGFTKISPEHANSTDRHGGTWVYPCTDQAAIDALPATLTWTGPSGRWAILANRITGAKLSGFVKHGSWFHGTNPGLTSPSVSNFPSDTTPSDQALLIGFIHCTYAGGSLATVPTAVDSGSFSTVKTVQTQTAAATSADIMSVFTSTVLTAGLTGTKTATMTSFGASSASYMTMIEAAPVVVPSPPPSLGYVAKVTQIATVTNLISTTPFFVAHRGGSRSYPEHSRYAYDQSVKKGYACLEMSLGRTSDGVWFGLHDASLDRTSLGTGGGSGTQLVASQMTWAQVQQYQILASLTDDPAQPNRPYMRLDELIAAYGKTHVIMLDPKAGYSFRSELFTIMAANGGPARFIGKYSGVLGPLDNSSGWAPELAAAGYRRWGYFYENDYTNGNMDLYQGRWDLLGMDYNASQAAWTKVLSYGKPVIGHIAPSQTGVTTALGYGASGMMVSGTKTVVPTTNPIVIAKKAVVSRYVIIGGVKKAVKNRWVIAGGIKKSAL